MPRDKLRVQGMIFHAYHGLYKDERENGQRFEIDVELEFDAHAAAESDRIRDTIDVRQVYNLVKDIVLNECFYLIETMSQRIAAALLDEFGVPKVMVKVRKPFAPLGGLANGTEIEVIREK
jgi:7,8-dihydroneopterin aldolase/epimerase/oxygenase